MLRRHVRRSLHDDRVTTTAAARLRRGAVVIASGALAVSAARDIQQPRMPPPPSNITAVPGLTVGHATLAERPTGCTVVLVERGATGAVDVRGGAPGTVETDLLQPHNTVEQVHAVFLAGGSAFGLETRAGVVRYLEEKQIGFRTGAGPVPIVPGAILYDLGVGGRPEIRPGPDCGYRAARAAASGALADGSVGAGAGATIGKMMGTARAMKGGIGSAALTTSDGLVVGAIVAVNAVGSIVDPRTGRAVAGVRTADGRALEDPFALVRRGVALAAPAREHTTIGVIATNARLTKAQARKVVEMAHDGLARTIVPSHTPADGDTLFALATGDLSRDVSLGTIGALAAEAVSDAILRAVRTARGLPGYPAVADLR
jgi:L-aminopeptidase/D-esterase-like protein